MDMDYFCPDHGLQEEVICPECWRIIKSEDELRDIHAKDYTGTDDDMADDFENWLADNFNPKPKWYKH